MTTLATVPELRESLELSGRDREAAQSVADGIRDTKAENTRGPTPPHGGGFKRGPKPVATRNSPLPRRQWPST